MIPGSTRENFIDIAFGFMFMRNRFLSDPVVMDGMAHNTGRAFKFCGVSVGVN